MNTLPSSSSFVLASVRGPGAAASAIAAVMVADFAQHRVRYRYAKPCVWFGLQTRREAS